jgi:hypothetical protein
MVKVIRPFAGHGDAYVKSLRGTFLDERHFDVALEGEDCDVHKPDGSPLVVYRHAALPAGVCERAATALRRAARETSNRGVAAGGGRSARVKRDGTRGRTTCADPVGSGIIGFFDRTARFPYCRTTAFTAQDARRWASVQPLVHAVDGVFRRELPERYAAQMAVVRRTHPAWVIPGTIFTTITVNRNYVSAAHTDKGDLKEGFGVMAVLRSGDYDGGCLVFPKYRVAVDLGDRDVLLADLHEVHGNTGLVGEEGEYERLSLVFYYRAGMRHCLSPTEELERAKRRRRGTPLNA